MQNYAGEEEKEELLSFNADELLGEGAADGGDEWVATHSGAKGQWHTITSRTIIYSHQRSLTDACFSLSS